MKWLAPLLVTLMLVVGIGVAVVLSSAERGEADTSTPSGTSEPPGRPSLAPGPSPEVAFPESFAFGEPNASAPNATGQSRLWFHDGAWWGVFLTMSTGDQRMYRLDAGLAGWTDTSLVVDDRTFARLDLVSEGDGLVVASAGPQARASHALRISRFSYDPAARVYRRDANFPVPITDVGVEALTLARSDDGRMWLAYRQDGRMAIDHSLESELAWRGPFVPDVADEAIEEVAIASLGDRVAVAWTHPSDDNLSVAWHDTAGPEDVWQASPDARVAGLSMGEDELSVATDRSPGAERLFVAVRTSADEAPDRDRLDPQVVVVEFPVGSEPTSYLFGVIDDQHAGPIILIDSEAREMHVVAVAPKVGGAIYYKTTSLDRISFPTGPGTPLIPASDEHPRLAHPTSTKQALDGTTGMVVAASDTGAGLYGFGVLGGGGGTIAGPHPSASTLARAPLVDITFDGLAVGAPVRGWELDGDPPPSFVISVLTGSDSSARLSGSTGDARACLQIADVSGGQLRVEIEGLFNLASDQELRLAEVRSVEELASVRLRSGQVVYGDGLERIDSGLILVPGRWYRSILDLDLDSQTYSLEIREAASDAVLLQETQLGWRSTESSIVNRLCAELPPQPGLDLYLDDVRVTTEGGS